ncbi:MAG: fasciclin domain-containing protein [Planctomycetota bacterium]
MKRLLSGALAMLVVASSAVQTHAADIVDTAVAAGQFKTLAAAAGAAGLVDTLKGDGPFTVFAPTDEAFAKLPAGTVESLLKPENKDKLIAILTYHVVGKQVPASTVVTLKSAKTVNGASVKIKASDEGVMVNDANVIKTDIACDNGLIHVIDTVLLPPDKPAKDASALKLDATCQKLAATVAKGAPMFNSGHHHACADLYMETLTSMMHSSLGDDMKGHISTVIRNAKRQSSASDRAWTLRRGIDQMYTTLVSTK